MVGKIHQRPRRFLLNIRNEERPVLQMLKLIKTMWFECRTGGKQNGAIAEQKAVPKSTQATSTWLIKRLEKAVPSTGEMSDVGPIPYTVITCGKLQVKHANCHKQK